MSVAGGMVRLTARLTVPMRGKPIFSFASVAILRNARAASDEHFPGLSTQAATVRRSVFSFLCAANHLAGTVAGNADVFGGSGRTGRKAKGKGRDARSSKSKRYSQGGLIMLRASSN